MKQENKEVEFFFPSPILTFLGSDAFIKTPDVAKVKKLNCLNTTTLS